MARKKIQHKISSNHAEQKKLEVVLKCDVAGTAEAISDSLAEINVPGVQIDLIQTGIGNVSKSDVMMARTGSKLVLGFSGDTMPKLEQEIK
jgi:translation initiation factor IF-2